MTLRNGDYEPVPDVESSVAATASKRQVDAAQATLKAKETYPDLQLNDDQARLLGTLDEAMQFSKLDLNLSASSAGLLLGAPEDYKDKAQKFLTGMIQPTLMAAITFLMALYLQAQVRIEQEGEIASEQVHSITDLILPLFPYLNATLMFLSTVIPLQKRFTAQFVVPIFQAMNRAEDLLKATVRELGPFVDQTIDGVQQDFHVILKPIQPVLDQFQGKAKWIEQYMNQAKKASPNNQNQKEEEAFDIPDPSDIDRELDEAQGIVTDKMKEAEQHLEYENYTPSYLDSPRQFYWRIVVPVLVLAWILQMTVAYGRTPMGGMEEINASPSPLQRRMLRGGPDYEDIVDLRDNVNATLDSVQENFETVRDNITSELNDFKGEVKDQAQELTDLAKDYKSNLTNQLHDYDDTATATWNSLRGNWTDHYHNYQKQADETWRNQLDLQSKLVEDVLWSYLLAALQMLLVYLLTSEVVQAWVVHQGMKQVQRGAERTLEEYGVSVALDDVFGTRFQRIKEKILNLIRVVKKMEQMLGKTTDLLPGDTKQKLEDIMGEGQEALGDSMKDAAEEGKKIFGRFFKS